MNQEQDPGQLAEIRCLAEQGNAEAQFSLGFRYDEGEGVPQDSQEAVKWWRKAAEQGHDQAQFQPRCHVRNRRGCAPILSRGREVV